MAKKGRISWPSKPLKKAGFPVKPLKKKSRVSRYKGQEFLVNRLRISMINRWKHQLEYRYTARKKQSMKPEFFKTSLIYNVYTSYTGNYIGINGIIIWNPAYYDQEGGGSGLGWVQCECGQILYILPCRKIFTKFRQFAFLTISQNTKFCIRKAPSFLFNPKDLA